MDFPLISEECPKEEKVAKHEAAHFIVMVYLLGDNLPLMTSIKGVALFDDGKNSINGKIYFDCTKQEAKEFLYIYLAGKAMESLIEGDSYKLLTDEIPTEYSDLGKYLALYSKLNNGEFWWHEDKTSEIINKDFQYTVKLCKELEDDINGFATLLLEKRIITEGLLAQEIEKILNRKRLIEDFS